jgi:hypothetical protein
VFRDASEFMSGSKYPTLSISLFTYVKLHTKLRKFQHSPEARVNRSLHKGIIMAQEKLMKYFDCSTYESEYYYFASGKVTFNAFTVMSRTFQLTIIYQVFDPRMKDRIFKHNPDLFDSEWVEGCYSTLIDFLEKSDPPSMCSDPISNPSSSAGHFLDDDDGILGHYGPSLLSHPADPESAKGELQRYLSIDPIHLQDHPLLWWKQNEAHFPRIAAGAKAYLAIPGQ